jgi:hypothetical protein
MKKKDQQILIPPIIGLIVAFFASTFLELALDKYYFPFDPDFGFDFSMYATIYTMLFIPLLIVATVFQYFVVLKIWGKHIENKKILMLNLWQLICVSCLIFGLLVSTYQYRRFYSIDNFILIFARRTLFVLAYWFTNYFTMKRLGNPLDTKSVVKNV